MTAETLSIRPMTENDPDAILGNEAKDFGTDRCSSSMILNLEPARWHIVRDKEGMIIFNNPESKG